MTARQQTIIEELYLSLYDELYSYAWSVLHSEPLAEEAVQETFRVACAKPDSLCGSPNPRGWLVNTLKNVLTNIHRRRTVAEKIVTEYLEDRMKNLGATSDQVSVDLLYENVADSEEFRLMKELALDGKSLLELAQERNISVTACRKRLQRAREILQKRLNKR